MLLAKLSSLSVVKPRKTSPVEWSEMAERWREREVKWRGWRVVRLSSGRLKHAFRVSERRL